MEGDAVLVRKTRGAEAGGPAGSSFGRVLRQAADAALGLALDVTSEKVDARSSAQAIAALPQGGLLVRLAMTDGATALLALDAALTASVLEQVTLGRVLSGNAPQRRPTATDLAMAQPLLDSFLSGLAEGVPPLSEVADARLSGLLPGPVDAELVLPAGAVTQLVLEIALAEGARRGMLCLVAPARTEGSARPGWSRLLESAVLPARTELQAELCRLPMKVSALARLAPGDVLEVPTAALASVALRATGGRRMALARLGQIGGLRALCLDGGASAPQPFSPAGLPGALPKEDIAPPPLDPPPEPPDQPGTPDQPSASEIGEMS